MRKSFTICGVCALLAAFARVIAASAQQKGIILEEIVARVNNDIITRGDLSRAQVQLRTEAQQDCPSCTPEQIDAKVASQQKDVLRDLIDNSLMVQRAKDMGINVETDVVKRLDEIRIQNKIASMEDLEKEVTKSGMDYEDFKNNIRNQLLQQEVIRREVGSRIIIDHAEVQKYYDEHKAEFVRPEQVVVREIFISTENKPESEVPALRKKAEGLLDRVKNGDDFGELAKRFSDGSTAKQGGDLGTFGRGQLAPNLEALAFKMNKNDLTDVIDTKTGFLILQVQEHYPAGQQTEEKVDSDIMNRLYSEKMKPAMRDYLDTLRQDSYLEVKPGYIDSGASAVASNPIEEVPPTPDNVGKKKGRKASADPVAAPAGTKKNGL